VPHINNPGVDWCVTAYIVREHEGTYQVLLCDHRKLGYWTPIGGHVEPHEDPITALYREIGEECGEIEVQLLYGRTGASAYHGPMNRDLPKPDFFDVHPIETEQDHHHVGLGWICWLVSGEPTLSDEHRELHWFSQSSLNNGVEMPINVFLHARDALHRIKLDIDLVRR